jgi:pimeloyl-ACP methyl ester carboxylesterase
MHHIGLGRTLDGTRIISLIHGYAIRVIHAAIGEIIRTLTINPQRRDHGTGKPTGGLCEFARIITTTSFPVVTGYGPRRTLHNPSDQRRTGMIGHGEPFVVLHGGSGMWYDELFPFFDDLATDHQVIFYDQRGNGKSLMGEPLLVDRTT